MHTGMTKRARTGARRTIAPALFAALAMAATPAAADTLREALAKTYATNPDLAAEQSRVRRIDEDVAQANAMWRPSLSIEGEYENSRESIKTSGAKFDVRSETWEANLVATQPLFTGGRNGAEKDAALARVREARARLRGVEQKVLLDTVTAYVDVARNEAVVDLTRNDIVLLQDLLKETRDRREKKSATDSDVDQVLAALEAARAGCIAQMAALQDSWRAYEQVVGERPGMAAADAPDAPQVNPCVDAKGSRTPSTVTMPRDLPAAPASLEDVEKAAQGDVPEIAAARANEEHSRSAVSAAYAELLPTAQLTAKIGTNGEEEDPSFRSREATVTAELNIPLFATGAEWSEIRAARERANQARLEITSSQRRVMRDALHAWYELTSIRAVRTVNKMQAETILRAFEGLRREMADPKLHRSVTDLLGLRQVYLITQTTLIGSDRDEAVAIYRLLAAMGNLNAKYLELPVEIYDPEINLRRQRGRLVGDSIQGDK